MSLSNTIQVLSITLIIIGVILITFSYLKLIYKLSKISQILAYLLGTCAYFTIAYIYHYSIKMHYIKNGIKPRKIFWELTLEIRILEFYLFIPIIGLILWLTSLHQPKTASLHAKGMFVSLSIALLITLCKWVILYKVLGN